MRVLHLTTEFPWPGTGGGPVRTLAQLEVCASLPEVESITLLSVTERPVAAAECAALAAAVPKLRVLPPVFHPIHLWKHPRHIPRVLGLRAFGVPYLVAKWDSPTLRALLRQALHDSAADVVYVDHLGMARYLPEIRAARPRARVVLEEHNVESEFFRRLVESTNGARRVVAAAEWRAAARFEKRVLESVDAVVAISQADAEEFERLASVHVHVVPVVVESGRPRRPHPGRPHFCYVGSLRWRPNVAGLDWLCQAVWPRIRQRVPDATLEIAGVDLDVDARGAPRVPEAWKVPGVATVGFLADLEPLYARSLAMLAPVSGGSGVRIKVLEGFRAGLPVVTTPDGARGLPLTDGTEALIASDPDAFAERVVRLVTDESLRARLRDAGWDYLATHHAPSSAVPPLRAALGIDPSQ